LLNRFRLGALLTCGNEVMQNKWFVIYSVGIGVPATQQHVYRKKLHGCSISLYMYTYIYSSLLNMSMHDAFS
jgi:hypothetical protein